MPNDRPFFPKQGGGLIEKKDLVDRSGSVVTFHTTESATNLREYRFAANSPPADGYPIIAARRPRIPPSSRSWR